jgi:hypothetical protein
LAKVFFDEVKFGDGFKWSGSGVLAGLKGFVESPSHARPATRELNGSVLAAISAVGGVAILLQSRAARMAWRCPARMSKRSRRSVRMIPNGFSSEVAEVIDA